MKAKAVFEVSNAIFAWTSLAFWWTSKLQSSYLTCKEILTFWLEGPCVPLIFLEGKYVRFWKKYFEIQVCFFLSDELENNVWVVEKYACASKNFGIILPISTYTFKFSMLPEPGFKMFCSVVQNARKPVLQQEGMTIKGTLPNDVK